MELKQRSMCPVPTALIVISVEKLKKIENSIKITQK